MQIVISITEELFKATVNGLDANEIWDLRAAVKNGTPLPEEHGDLLDAYELWDAYHCLDYDFYETLRRVKPIIKGR